MTCNKTCGRCGIELDDSTPEGYCLSCLLREGLTEPEPESKREESAVQKLCSGGSQDFGDYEVMELIARGGMGVVYRARQKSLNRIVALKMLLSGQFSDPKFAQRFRAEAEAVAQLQHPNIVAIHEVGECRGQPFFSMDYVAGKNLATVIADSGSRTADVQCAVRWLKTIAEAVHYAHTRGIIHRDLKPSNILIDQADQPRITDFGLAKRLTGDSDLTLTGQVLGSPNYLSPEQAAGKQAEVGPPSDVYSLGGILYHLLTGRPPFQAESLTTLLKLVLETEPVAPRLLNPSLPRDLETICLKCLEKEKSRRYQTAQEVAEELVRFSQDQPIHARPAGVSEKVWRWCRRQPVRASLIAALGLVVVLGSTAVLWQWQQAMAARVRSEQERYAANIALAQTLIEQQRFDQARQLLAREGQERNRGWEWGWLQRQCNLDLMSLTLPHNRVAYCASFSPDARYLVTGGADATPRMWELATGREVRAFHGHNPGWVFSACFSPDGQRLLTGSSDGSARLWDVATGHQLHVLTNDDKVIQAVFSPDGRVIATAGYFQGVKLWDAVSGGRLPINVDHEQAVFTVAFSPDGQRLAYAGGRAFPVDNDMGSAWLDTNNTHTTVGVLDLTNGKRSSFKAHRKTIHCLQFNPEGTLLATAGWDGAVHLWNPETGAEARPLQSDFGQEVVFSVDFSPDGRWLAVAGGVGGRFGRAEIFEVSSGQRVRRLQGHFGVQSSIQFDAAGGRLATASYDGTTRIWSTSALRDYVSLEGHDQPVWAVAFSKDGRRLASGSLDQTARVWDTETATLLATINAGFPVVSLALSPNGERLVTISTNGTAKVWSANNGEEILTLSGHTGTVMAVDWSPDGRWILTGSKDGTARLWNAMTSEQVLIAAGHSNWVLCVAFSPAGSFALSS